MAPGFAATDEYCSMKKRTERPATWLAGKKTRLRPLEAQDVPQFRRYKLAIDPKAIGFIVQTHAGRDIGALALSIEGPQAAIAIAVADRRHLSDGLASDALRVMWSGAFRSLPLARIESLVLADDPALLSAYRRAGFKREGVLRSVARVRRAYKDTAVMSVVRDV
jgi:RimJ/RimL family protein N-acetyltransferase